MFKTEIKLFNKIYVATAALKGSSGYMVQMVVLTRKKILCFPGMNNSNFGCRLRIELEKTNSKFYIRIWS